MEEVDTWHQIISWKEVKRQFISGTYADKQFGDVQDIFFIKRGAQWLFPPINFCFYAWCPLLGTCKIYSVNA